MSERPDPDQLLGEIKAADDAQATGRMKIFFGYAAGVGKTFAMLEAAHQAQTQGIDVVVGYVEPHTRPETMALLDGLEQLPPRPAAHGDITLREFDLDGALARHPQLILVDELAHTNAEGSRHRKRYKDVQELLKAGIDVYTTVNVQHLESLNDMVSAITGVVVNERVPDAVFDSASQVELVDIEPDDLIARLHAGKVYRQQQAQQALNNFFIRDNLVALREIALRRTADRLNRSPKTQGRRTNVASEHILTCLSPSPTNAKVIRTAARMAEAFHSSFTALLVENAQTENLRGEDLRRLRANVKLAEDLGARVATAYGEDVPLQIAEYANASGVSKVVIGRSNNRRRFGLPSRSLVDRLTTLAPQMDVYVIPDARPPYAPPRQPHPPFRLSGADLLKTLAIVAGSTLVGVGLDLGGFGEANIITVYILGVLFTSVVTRGRLYGILASLASVLAYNFLFTTPRFTFQAYDASYPVTFLIMFTAAFITSTLTMQVKNQARQAARKAYRTEILLQTSQKLQQAEGEGALLEALAQQMLKLLDTTVVLYPSGGAGQLGQPRLFLSGGEDARAAERYLAPEEQAVAQWAFRNNKHAGATTNTLPSAQCLYLAVRGQREVFAVAGVAMREDAAGLDAFTKNLLIAMLGEGGLAMEKMALAQQKQQAQMQAKQEQLRANLLRAISHDLRTPLTSISGNAGILMVNARVLDEDKRQQLYTDIYDDAMWLFNLVENLLSVTRIENGTMSIHMEPELLDEIFHEALSHVNRRAVEHHIRVHLQDDLLMAQMDARLIVQVIINIVDNAIKYTERGSHIDLSARLEGNMVRVDIADDGPGVAPEAKARLFDMFYTVTDQQRTDGRRGLGLGLSLCQSIVQAHGGAIEARDNHPKGTIFSFTLKHAEVTNLE